MAHIINGCPRVAQYQYKLQQHGERNKNYESETFKNWGFFNEDMVKPQARECYWIREMRYSRTWQIGGRSITNQVSQKSRKGKKDAYL